jgi:hypothetical protein
MAWTAQWLSKLCQLLESAMNTLLRRRQHDLLSLICLTFLFAPAHAYSLNVEPLLSDSRAAALLEVQREAEARSAVAEAERAELLASLPPSSSIKSPQGSTDATHFGAAGLVRAFDLTQELAHQVCAALPPDHKTTLYDPASALGVTSARTVVDGINRLVDDISRQNKELQFYIDSHTLPGSKTISPLLVALTVIPATVRAAADTTSLFKTDITATGIGYGDGARGLFGTSLARSCGERLTGLGSGYLGELDDAQHERLLARVRALASQRNEFANRIAILERMADDAKGDEKKDLNGTANAATVILKSVDTFVDSLRAGEANDRSPLFNAARYLSYATRANGSLVLEFDLRLEGLSIVKEVLFSGQQLRLAGVAFLWYRLYEPNGTLRAADAVRMISKPVEVDLRGEPANGEFWGTGIRSGK